jgi:hypothetical protein
LHVSLRVSLFVKLRSGDTWGTKPGGVTSP